MHTNLSRSTEDLESLAGKIRKQVLRMTSQARSSHIGSNYSMIELLAVLYGGVLRFRSQEPSWPDRDRLIISKGHAAAAVYAVLADSGFMPEHQLDSFYQNGSLLAGHVTHSVPGVEVATGSLGHGLSIATGMALVGKRDDKPYRVFCILSDGECDEGSTWEPVLFAPQHRLDNLVAIIDYNKIQSLGTVEDVMALEPLAEKWRAFGWAVEEIDGHDLARTRTVLERVPFRAGQPSCVIAHTIKGKGVSFMENKLLWHYRSPQGEELQAALAELEVNP